MVKIFVKMYQMILILFLCIDIIEDENMGEF